MRTCACGCGRVVEQPKRGRSRLYAVDRCRKRRWDRAHPEAKQTSCPQCGGVMDRKSTRCRDCLRAWEAVQRTLIEGMWADGWSAHEISTVVGWDFRGAIGAWRLRGWDLPYRYRNTKRQREAMAA
jgi:hypothetical protein